MKKILSILTLFTFVCVLTSNAQSKSVFKSPVTNHVIKVAVSLSNNIAYESLEVGNVYGKNTLTAVGQTFKVGSSGKEQWAAGVKYSRNVYQADKFSFNTTGSVLVNLTGSVRSLTFNPGVTAGISLTKNIALDATLSSPIAEGSTLFKPVNFRSGLQLVISL